MKKVRIELDPQGPITIEREVAIPTFDGSPLKVCFAFRVRTRVDFAEQIAQPRIDRMSATAREAVMEQREVAKTGEIPSPKDIGKLAAAHVVAQVASILAMASDWGIEGQDFNEENVRKFVNLYPGAEDAIFEDYRKGSVEGRLGNS